MAAETSPTHDPYAALRVPAYRNYAIGGFVSVIGRQMLAMAVGFEVFKRTNSATAIGFVGLMGALPVIFLSLPAGQVADRFSRKWIILATQTLLFFTSLALALLAGESVVIPNFAPLAWADRGLLWIAAAFGESKGVVFGPEIPLIYLLVFANGTARAFGWAARSPFVANIVPRDALPNAAIWNSSTFEIGTIVGPALGGLLIAAFGFPPIYLLDAVCSLVFISFVLPIPYQQTHASRHVHPLRDLFSGIRFVWQMKPILATITLDLFAVLLGGATALLPIFADRILHVGAPGLGWLRAAPSFGAVTMALTLAHLPPMRRAGITMLCAVAGFGAATVVFGLSQNFWLSMAALMVTGACDNISVVVRHTLVQLLTPDPMRGRVSAVNNVFIGSSNELGAFESGITAALFGPVLSVVAGGIGTMFVVLGVARTWPEIRRIGRLQQVGEVDRETA
jgi:MFS family permease